MCDNNDDVLAESVQTSLERFASTYVDSSHSTAADHSSPSTQSALWPRSKNLLQSWFAGRSVKSEGEQAIVIAKPQYLQSASHRGS